jgi:hypothetical protein
MITRREFMELTAASATAAAVPFTILEGLVKPRDGLIDMGLVRVFRTLDRTLYAWHRRIPDFAPRARYQAWEGSVNTKPLGGVPAGKLLITNVFTVESMVTFYIAQRVVPGSWPESDWPFLLDFSIIPATTQLLEMP